jgi:hypothetical protein
MGCGGVGGVLASLPLGGWRSEDVKKCVYYVYFQNSAMLFVNYSMCILKKIAWIQPTNTMNPCFFI